VRAGLALGGITLAERHGVTHPGGLRAHHEHPTAVTSFVKSRNGHCGSKFRREGTNWGRTRLICVAAGAARREGGGSVNHLTRRRARSCTRNSACTASNVHHQRPPTSRLERLGAYHRATESVLRAPSEVSASAPPPCST
jgi:hypothetical protein